MTIRALLDLLDEIDHEGGPRAARHNRLHLLSEGTQPMTTAPVAPPAVTPTLAAVPQPADPAPQPVSVGQLLKWADEHNDEQVRDQAARARAALTGLRRRYDADHELAAIASEADQLEQRLAQLRSREAELAPPKAKQRKKQPLDYNAATVRAWARTAGIECPAVGRVPKTIVEQWKAAGSPEGAA